MGADEKSLAAAMREVMTDQMDTIECDCECHYSDSDSFHCVPCCQACPHCEMRFRSGYESHIKTCIYRKQ